MIGFHFCFLFFVFVYLGGEGGLDFVQMELLVSENPSVIFFLMSTTNNLMNKG